MKKATNISKNSRSILSFTGILVAFLLMLQQPLHFVLQEDAATVIEVSAQSEEEGGDKKENEQKSNESTQYVAKAYDVVLPVLQITLDQAYNIVEELPSLDNFFPSIQEEQFIKNDYFFTVLFRQIISPNAP